MVNTGDNSSTTDAVPKSTDIPNLVPESTGVGCNSRIPNTADVVVIGGGFWGVASALLLRDAGFDTILLDNKCAFGASRNAAGIVCRRWYSQATIRKMLPQWVTKEVVNESIDFLCRFGLEQADEVFTSYRTSRVNTRNDCYILPSLEPLLSIVPTTQCDVYRVTPSIDNGVLVYTSRGGIKAKHAVIACGAYTDNLLDNSMLPLVGVSKLTGRALLCNHDNLFSRNILDNPNNSQSSPLKPVVYTHMMRPYTQYTSRPWGQDMQRVGDTVERTTSTKTRDRTTRELYRAASILCPESIPRVVLEGVRPVCKQMVVEKVCDGVIVATGGHRVGLGLAGAVARRVVYLVTGG